MKLFACINLDIAPELLTDCFKFFLSIYYHIFLCEHEYTSMAIIITCGISTSPSDFILINWEVVLIWSLLVSYDSTSVTTSGFIQAMRSSKVSFLALMVWQIKFRMLRLVLLNWCFILPCLFDDDVCRGYFRWVGWVNSEDWINSIRVWKMLAW